MNTILSLGITLVGGLLTIVGMLIVLNLRSIKKYLTSLNARLDGHESRLAIIELERISNVSKEDWVRSEAFNRNKLDRLNASLSRIEGKLQVVEKLPEISGAIAREIVKELNQTR